jgi:hypothetical protein
MPPPEPAHDLVAVKFLASTDCLRLGVGPAHDRLRVLFDGPGSQRQRRRFAKGIIALLSPSDFVRTTRDTVGPDDKPLEYDVYAIQVDVASLQSLGATVVDGVWPTTWYVKLAIFTSGGRKVHLLSLHCLEKVARRADGMLLSPEWDDGYEKDD